MTLPCDTPLKLISNKSPIAVWQALNAMSRPSNSLMTCRECICDLRGLRARPIQLTTNVNFSTSTEITQAPEAHLSPQACLRLRQSSLHEEDNVKLLPADPLCAQDSSNIFPNAHSWASQTLMLKHAGFSQCLAALAHVLQGVLHFMRNCPAGFPLQYRALVPGGPCLSSKHPPLEASSASLRHAGPR